MRHRKPRFNNRRRPEGWLPPSTKHLVDGVLALVKKFTRLAPIRLIVIESVKFDTQALDNPLISGIEYQQGTLSGYTQYLLERFNHRRVYRDAKNVPLEIDHVIPKSKGGSDRVSNLVIARGKRDQKKGNRDLDDFLGPRSNVAKKIERGEKLSLADAAAMNSIRKATIKSLKDLELPAREAATAETRYNRGRFGVPKFHAGDAACAGPMSDLKGWNANILVIASLGRGQRRREQSDKYGFPQKSRAILSNHKKIEDFITKDFVKGEVTRGLNKGAHVGRVTVQSSGQFYIKKDGKKISFSRENAKLLQRGDGYDYSPRISRRLA